MLSIVLIVTTTILCGLLYLSQYKFNYWKKKNVPYAKPLPLLGNYGSYITFREMVGTAVDKLCQQFPNEPYFGAYYGTEPTLIVKDPKMIKLVMTKDFYYFNGREITNYCDKEVTTQNMFFNGGDMWKVVRQNLTPLFSTGKMKNMFYLVEKCVKQFETLLDTVVEKNKEGVDARLIAGRFTMESIGNTVFGVDTHTLEEPHNPNNPFAVIGVTFFSTSIVRGFKLVLRAVWPAVFYAAGFQVFPDSLGKFFTDLLKDVFKSRGYKPSGRNDFIDLLLNLKKNKYLVGESINSLKTDSQEKAQLEVTDDLLISQCVMMFAAGYETSATTQGFALFELAKNKEAQKRAHAEVDEFLKRHNNHVTYDCMTEMPYLDACIEETLRLYPVLSVITREVAEDYIFPSGLKVEQGIRVHIPVWHVHRNPDFFPDPEQFKPERFLPENKDNIQSFTVFNFGEGQRSCIGKRFGKMQVLAGLITFLKKYSVELADDMPLKIDFEPVAIVTQPIQDIKLKFIPREGWEQRVYNVEMNGSAILNA